MLRLHHLNILNVPKIFTLKSISGVSNDFDTDGSLLCSSNLSIYNGEIPDEYSINKIYPNHFNPIANIIYGIPENAHVEIFVYDIRGRHIATLMDSFQFAGYHSISWEASAYPSGMYFVKIISNTFTTTNKIVLIK